VFLHLIHITDIMVVVDQVDQVDLDITLALTLLLMVQHQVLHNLTDLDKVVMLQQILVAAEALHQVLHHHQHQVLLVVLVDQEL
tara:strand:+ start:255 stop:506 length:252 start_codon:yes stop_codon:yes gene_type:complete